MQEEWLADVLSFAHQIVETDAVVADCGIAVGARGAEKGQPPTQAIGDYATLEQPRDRRAAMLAAKSSTLYGQCIRSCGRGGSGLEQQEYPNPIVCSSLPARTPPRVFIGWPNQNDSAERNPAS
jgi:hypothetical protein